jgi:hypothetical protein
MVDLLKSAVLGGLAIVVASSTALAEPLALAGANDDEWRFSLTPYLFLPVSTTGTSTVAGGEADVDLSLSDVFDALNMSLSARVEALKGDFGLIVEGYFVHIGGDETIDLPGPLGGTVGVDVSVEQGWVDLLGAYRVAHGTFDETERRYSVDVQAGVRYNHLRQKIKADLAFDIGPGDGFQRNLGGTENWWEPVVGLRSVAQINDRWSAGAMADFGGFGVGDDDLQWKVRLGADYRPWEQTSLKFGWQFYGIDYETTRSDGKFAYDVFQTGPFVGVTFRFQ